MIIHIVTNRNGREQQRYSKKKIKFYGTKPTENSRKRKGTQMVFFPNFARSVVIDFSRCVLPSTAKCCKNS